MTLILRSWMVVGRLLIWTGAALLALGLLGFGLLAYVQQQPDEGQAP